MHCKFLYFITTLQPLKIKQNLQQTKNIGEFFFVLIRLTLGKAHLLLDSLCVRKKVHIIIHFILDVSREMRNNEDRKISLRCQEIHSLKTRRNLSISQGNATADVIKAVLSVESVTFDSCRASRF